MRKNVSSILIKVDENVKTFCRFSSYNEAKFKNDRWIINSYLSYIVISFSNKANIHSRCQKDGKRLACTSCKSASEEGLLLNSLKFSRQLFTLKIFHHKGHLTIYSAAQQNQCLHISLRQHQLYGHKQHGPHWISELFYWQSFHSQ